MSRFSLSPAMIVSLVCAASATFAACSGPPSDIATPREIAPADVVPEPVDAGFDIDADAAP